MPIWGAMSIRFENIPQRRAIIDRRALADRLHELPLADGDRAALRALAGPLFREALDHGRAEIARRLDATPARGSEIAASYAFLTDQILRLIYDFTLERLYPNNNPSAGERLVLIAVGGYGRGEMALYSDVDIAFVTPWKQTGWCEQVIEAMLYQLWDLGLKIGHSSRSADDVIRMAKSDLTIRTALLEGRYVWGDEKLYDQVAARFDREVVSGTARNFVAEKLGERDGRHRRMGDSRYVVEPNLKEGKGGLRDLHTLFWIGKYAYQVRSVAELVDKGLLSSAELRQFQRAENFLWAVRCHLHIAAGRAEDRLTFDIQTEVAQRMRYADRPGKTAVERFMQHYFLTAKQVGDLTGVFLSHLDELFAGRGRRFGLPNIRRRPKNLKGFLLDRGRLALPREGFFEEDPVRLIEMFSLADTYGLEIHPLAMRSATRDVRLIDNTVRRDPRANAFFLNVLTSPRDPERVLRAMNEAGVFGRFVPDFGRVVAQMQFDMYHHYTVDEHLLRCVGILQDIERGGIDEFAVASDLMRKIRPEHRAVIYMTTLLHDIAKGRPEDHSIAGAKIARRLCPRFGFNAADTELIAWLIQEHLTMSTVAQSRDLSDRKTIENFAAVVQSVEQMKLLTILTTADIRGVGPGVWNGWKAQLIRTLYYETEPVLTGGFSEVNRAQRIHVAQHEFRAAFTEWPAAELDAYIARQYPAYWLKVELPRKIRHARFIKASEAGNHKLAVNI